MRALLVITLTALTLSASPSAAVAEAGGAAKLKVGVSPVAPFVMHEGSKTTGYTIDLWSTIAADLGADQAYVYFDGVKEKLDALEAGHIDVAIGGITITRGREEKVDFTHPTFRTGLDILVRSAGPGSYFSALAGLFTPGKVGIVIGFVLLIVIAGHLLWLAERGRKGTGASISDKYIPGVPEGMYWAVVTASTVGYGDKVPVRWAGRLVAVVVIIIALPLFAVFTAELASSFTVQSLKGNINGPEDLMGTPVGVVEGTTGQDRATDMGAMTYSYSHVSDAYQALLDGEVDAVIYDSPSLRYFADNEGKGEVQVVGRLFAPQRYGFAVAEGSVWREKINRGLLALNEDERLTRIYRKWFGDD